MVQRYSANWLYAFILGLTANAILFVSLGHTAWPIYFLLNLVFFGLLSYVTFRWVAQAMVKDAGEKVVVLVLLSLLIDMAGGIGFIFLAVKGFSVEALSFFVPFAIYYIGFSILKVVGLLRVSGVKEEDN